MPLASTDLGRSNIPPAASGPEESGSAWACTAVVTTNGPHHGYTGAMTTRRRRGEDGISFEHRGPCRDRTATGTAPACGAARSPSGTPATASASAAKSAARPRPPSWTSSATCTPSSTRASPPGRQRHYTVRHAAEDWLATGLDGRSPKTIKKNQNVLDADPGNHRRPQAPRADRRRRPAGAGGDGPGYSSAAVAMGHNALNRAIRHAEANDLVSRNVATLADTPKGQGDGRARG